MGTASIADRNAHGLALGATFGFHLHVIFDRRPNTAIDVICEVGLNQSLDAVAFQKPLKGGIQVLEAISFAECCRLLNRCL